MSQKLLTNTKELSLEQRVFALEQLKRRVAETLRNVKTDVKQFEETCNNYDPESESEIGTRVFKGNMYSYVTPVVSGADALRTAGLDSIIIDSPLEHVPGPLVVSSDSQVSIVQEQPLPPPLAPAEEIKALVLSEEQAISCKHEILQENPSSRDDMADIVLCKMLTNPPVEEAIGLSELDHGNTNVQCSIPIITSVFSHAVAVPIEAKSIANKHGFRILVENNKIPLAKQNPAEATQHASAIMIPPANKKIKLGQTNPPSRTTLTRLKSAPLKSPAHKVDEWLKGFDPKLGTMSQWLSYPKGDPITPERVPPKPQHTMLQTINNNSPNEIPKSVLHLMVCEFCNNLLSDIRCPKSLPAKKVTCYFCEREILQASFHRHLKRVHGNTVKTLCHVCRIPFPFSIIDKHIALAHGAAATEGSDKDSMPDQGEAQTSKESFIQSPPCTSATITSGPVFYPKYNNQKMGN